MNRKTVNEGKHIGRPFREINWRKVDEYQARGYRGRPFRFQGGGIYIPYNTLRAAKEQRADKED